MNKIDELKKLIAAITLEEVYDERLSTVTRNSIMQVHVNFITLKSKENNEENVQKATT